MAVITIPKHLHNKELVLIPKEEYEELKRMEPQRVFKEVSMTKAQKHDLETARRDYASGDFVTIDVLKHDLERRS
ncbi:MAG: hypothetical protein G01um101417_361 [Parcubacteria group bacterium Gr01-1014_17]|nr:MAG: hypothetical protein G01um101417_361 [Parcubacteria group bacterium Gr01-1014_17]